MLNAIKIQIIPFQRVLSGQKKKEKETGTYLILSDTFYEQIVFNPSGVLYRRVK